jgi:Kef-type K+ transport system membrane component KefB
LHGNSEAALAATLIELALIVGLARLAHVAARRLGQPGSVGEIVAGLMLGPSLLGALAPGWQASLFPPASFGTLQAVSQIGLILLMFQIGSDFHFGHLASAQIRRTTGAVALASLGGPLLLGGGLGWWAAPQLAPGFDRLGFTLFFAVAVAITAVPILGRILREFQLTRTPVGVVAISAAAVNDVVGWVLLAVAAAVSTAHFSAGGLVTQLGALAGFGLLLWGLGRPLARRIARHVPASGEELPAGVLAALLVLMFLAGVATVRLGIFAIFGGFAVGLLFHDHEHLVQAWRRQVGRFVLIFFLPIFFTFTGLRTDVLGLAGGSDALWCLAIFVVSCVAKVIPVTLAARLSGAERTDAMGLGLLMNTRALMELIVLNVGYDLGLLPRTVFTMLVLMAVGTTVITGPLLQRLYRGAGRPLQVVGE